MARRGWCSVPLLALGLAPLSAAEPSPTVDRAVAAWHVGQQALERDELDRAIGQFQLSLRLNPALAQNHLSLAAAYLARGQDVRAASHLERYVGARPEHVMVRSHLAEVLLRLGRSDEARRHLERFAADVQDQPRLAAEHLVHCHSRLMEIAQGDGDAYGEHLHRGIGLYRLALEREGVSEAKGLSVEGLLFQAAAELVLARRDRPDEARPCWYLHQVWSRLAQRQPATRWLRAAEAAAPFSALTPAERCGLELACQHRLAEVDRK
jgi:tetratricopeptide (TPR) repeat protein